MLTKFSSLAHLQVSLLGFVHDPGNRVAIAWLGYGLVVAAAISS
jgi:hypothetical protein